MSLPPPPWNTPNASTPPAKTCYRHPDRQTLKQCTRCGNPACTECLVTAPVGSHCVDCAKSAPKRVVKTRALSTSNRVPVTLGLITICVVLFVLSYAQDPGALLSRQLTPLDVRLDLIEPKVAEGQYYRLLTSGFMHYGLIHLGFNMFMLYQFGRLLEPATGSVRFALLYLSSLLAGSLGVIVSTNGVPTAGASGAVFGLMGAAAVGQWLRGVNPFRTSIGNLILINLVFTFLFPGIAIGAHIGGLIGGAVVGFFVLNLNPKQVPPWLQIVAPVVVGAGCVVASIVLAV